MEKLAKQEACQLFIEQEIEEGLEKGKTAYLIGKEVAEWIQKVFQARIEPSTIEKRAQRIRTNVRSDITPQFDKEIEGNQEIKWGGKRECAGRPPKFLVKEEHIHISDDSYEWCTPLEYIEAARAVMGTIDLDPATNKYAQEQIQATEYFTKEDDGLNKNWHGRVWLNPPFSMPVIEKFIQKLIDEFDAGEVLEAIVLTNNSTDTQWCHNLLTKYPVCFTLGRIPFWQPNGKPLATRQGQAIFYLGNNKKKFKEVFSQFGIVLKVYDNK